MEVDCGNSSGAKKLEVSPLRIRHAVDARALEHAHVPLRGRGDSRQSSNVGRRYLTGNGLGLACRVWARVVCRLINTTAVLEAVYLLIVQPRRQTYTYGLIH